MGTPAQLLQHVPVLPKMDVGFTASAFGRVSPRVSGRGPWQANFGTMTVKGQRAARVIDLVPPRAVWASGGYGWSSAQRSRWTGVPVALTRSLGDRAQRACSSSASATCVVAALPDPLRPAAAAQLTKAMVASRLSLTRDEKALLEPLLDRYSVEHPDDIATITQREVPSLPTTDGSDASGRIIEPSLFGLLAPPAWNSRPTVPYSTLRLWDSGVLWKDIEPRPGVFTWRSLDHAVQTAERDSKRVLLVLGPAPAWASADPDSPDESWGKGAPGPLTPTGTAAFATYVDAVVQRYGDRIWGYETWNEANLQTFWKGTPAQMAAMTKTVHDTVARHGAHSAVLSASATTRTQGSIYRFFPGYLKELEARGWPVDGFTVHAYPDADGTPSDTADHIAQFKAYLSIAGAPDLPIYNTELNYGLAGPGPDLAQRDMTAEQSQGWIARTFVDAVRLGVEQTHWFAWTRSYYGQYGIQLNPTAEASRKAWQTTYDWLVGSTFRSCQDPDGAVICQFERDGRPFWVAYADASALIDLPAGATQWCDLGGACRPASGTKVIVGVRPVRIT